jgi:hypothetical protein
MQSSDQIIEQKKPQEVNSSPNPQWIDKENGIYEYTGDKLYSIPNDLIGKIKFVSAPNAMIVKLSYCRNLKSFKAPKATYVNLNHCYN